MPATMNRRIAAVSGLFVPCHLEGDRHAAAGQAERGGLLDSGYRRGHVCEF